MIVDKTIFNCVVNSKWSKHRNMAHENGSEDYRNLLQNSSKIGQIIVSKLTVQYLLTLRH